MRSSSVGSPSSHYSLSSSRRRCAHQQKSTLKPQRGRDLLKVPRTHGHTRTWCSGALCLWGLSGPGQPGSGDARSGAPGLTGEAPSSLGWPESLRQRSDPGTGRGSQQPGRPVAGTQGAEPCPLAPACSPASAGRACPRPAPVGPPGPGPCPRGGLSPRLRTFPSAGRLSPQPSVLALFRHRVPPPETPVGGLPFPSQSPQERGCLP